MTKNEYMKTLSHNLRRLPKEDFDRALEYFEEYFAEAGEENEEQAIQDLGSPEEAAKELITTLAAKNVTEPPTTVKRGISAVRVGILGICAAPIALPLIAMLLLLALMLVLVIFMCVLCVFLFAVSLLASGIIATGGGLALIFSSFANGLATVGVGLVFIGIGLIAAHAFYCFAGWLIARFSQLLGRIVAKRRPEHGHDEKVKTGRKAS